MWLVTKNGIRFDRAHFPNGMTCCTFVTKAYAQEVVDTFPFEQLTIKRLSDEEAVEELKPN